jgi:cytochrome c553
MEFDMSSPRLRRLLAAAPVVMALALPPVAMAAGPSTAPKADISKGQAIAGAVCAACHAVDGNSVIPSNPILAAQHAAYIAKQLNNYQVKPGATKAERENAIMAGLAATLSEEDIRNVSAFYAAQAIKPSYAQDKELVALGQSIYRGGVPQKNIAACVGCHAPNGSGIPAAYPRLSGQHAEYTKAQLVAFRSGLRANSAQMMSISALLSDREIEAVSVYVAGLR